jgi:hypothetical protein
MHYFDPICYLLHCLEWQRRHGDSEEFGDLLVSNLIVEVTNAVLFGSLLD